MNVPTAAPGADVATVEQQLEQHAIAVERIQRDAIFEIGRELAAAQELFKYRRDEGGFTGWLAKRLPHIPQRSAYQAIEIAAKVPGMFADYANISPFALEQIAKAEPDIQKEIAERVAAVLDTVSDATGQTNGNVRVLLRKMLADGEIRQPKTGYYESYRPSDTGNTSDNSRRWNGY
jgi:hypothetical protein